MRRGRGRVEHLRVPVVPECRVGPVRLKQRYTVVPCPLRERPGSDLPFRDAIAVPGADPVEPVGHRRRGRRPASPTVGKDPGTNSCAFRNFAIKLTSPPDASCNALPNILDRPVEVNGSINDWAPR